MNCDTVKHATRVQSNGVARVHRLSLTMSEPPKVTIPVPSKDPKKKDEKKNGESTKQKVDESKEENLVRALALYLRVC